MAEFEEVTPAQRGRAFGRVLVALLAFWIVGMIGGAALVSKSLPDGIGVFFGVPVGFAAIFTAMRLSK